MFTLLSNRTQLLALLAGYSDKQLEFVCNNIALTIKELSIDIDQLSDNYRNLGFLISQETSSVVNISDDAFNELSLEQLINDQSHLIKAINTLCLTEAIAVRNNFCDCIESINEDYLSIPATSLSSVTNAVTESKIAISESIISENKKEEALAEKSNVAPIHLTEIKQRLAKAIIDSDQKKAQVKNKLNSLLSDKKTSGKTTSINIASKQA